MAPIELDYGRVMVEFLEHVDRIERIPEDPVIFSCRLGAIGVSSSRDIEDYESDVEVSVSWSYEEVVRGANSRILYPPSWESMCEDVIELTGFHIVGGARRRRKRSVVPDKSLFQPKISSYFTPNGQT